MLLSVRERGLRFREAFWRQLAWMLPGSLVYWAAVRLMAHATTGRHSDTVVPELTATDALQRWEVY
jgi:hypothetical protein